MGWFFNKNSNQSQNTQGNNISNQNSKFFSSSSYYSKTRKCENDPEDNTYMVCKTIIKDNNGTRQIEQRLPKNSQYSGRTNQSDQFSFRSTLNSDNNQTQEQRAFQKFPSFFIQPSFFDFHNSSPKEYHANHHQNYDPNNQLHHFFNSFSQSKSCYSDPQDKEYLICKSKVFDGKQTKQVEERVKVSDSNFFGLGNPQFGREFGEFGNQIDNQIHNLMRDINTGFNYMMPFIGPIMGFMNALNPQNFESKFQQQGGHSYQNYPRSSNNFTNKNNQSNSKYFSNASRKDTTVHDL